MDLFVHQRVIKFTLWPASKKHLFYSCDFPGLFKLKILSVGKNRYAWDSIDQLIGLSMALKEENIYFKFLWNCVWKNDVINYNLNKYVLFWKCKICTRMRDVNGKRRLIISHIVKMVSSVRNSVFFLHFTRLKLYSLYCAM